MPVLRATDRPVSTGESPACGPYRDEWLTKTGELSQFGAYITELPPGSASSIKHWHSAEDELILVMEGEVTLIEGDSETLLTAGDAATFKAGDPVGHCLTNRGDAPVRVLIVGTRADGDDICTYPDHDRVLHRRSEGREWTDHGGAPASNIYGEPQPR